MFKNLRNLFDNNGEDDIVEDDDIIETLDDFLKDCPLWIINKSVEELKKELPLDVVQEIKNAYKKDPETWWAFYHHGWGTSIRNFLRDKVCKDDELPSGNFDDYYIQLVELACELRTL